MFDGSDDVAALLCGSLMTRLGTSMPSEGGHIISAVVRPKQEGRAISGGQIANTV
jgi:hypothetical protein